MTSQLRCKVSRPAQTSSIWSRPTRGPMRTPSTLGSPMLILLRRCDKACATASLYPAGQSRPNSGALLPRFDCHFTRNFFDIKIDSSLPASTLYQEWSNSVNQPILKGIELATMLGCVFSLRPVAAEPVKVTTSCSCRCSNISPTPPQIS